MSDTITDLVPGDDYDIERNVSGIPAGALLAKAWLTVKRDPSEADDDTLIFKEITVAVTAHGMITDTGASGTGVVLFQLEDEDTEKLMAMDLYYWGIKVLTDTDKKYTVVNGKIIPKRRIIETEA